MKRSTSLRGLSDKYHIALSGAWSSPLKIEYVPSKYGPIFRYTGTDAVIVVNAEGKVVPGWGNQLRGPVNE